MKVRLADIARESEVSPSTVSLVLNDRPGIPVETRRRVLEVAARLGYQAPRRAMSMVAERSGQALHNLGLLIKSDPGQLPQANPFYSQVLAGIEDACRSRQVNLYYATLPVDDDNLPTDIPRLLNEDKIDGLLLVGTFVDVTLQHIFGRRILPVVLVDAYADADPYDAVVSDNARGAYMAVKYLLAHGHYHIGMIGGRNDAYPSLRQRRTGYLQALRDAGVTVSYVVDAAHGNVAEATTTLLTKHPHITALFAMNDEAAIAAMRAAQAMGRTTPTELSIVGFDDIELARHAMPALTTMHVDKIAMGRIAVQMLENRLAYPSSEQVTTVLRPRLIERESVIDIS